eukprot:6438920-Ditylum_brightwellii.AAC.1
MLYVKLQKALYGCLKSTMLLYKVLRKDIEEHGFQINPYDPCMANNDINGLQLTIVWLVDNLKLSHMDGKEIKKVLKWLEEKYWKMKTCRGKNHNYLGMVLDFLLDDSVIVDMRKYIDSTLKDFPQDILKTPPTPKGPNLFKINDECEKFPKELPRAFHTPTVKLLFLCN